MSLPRFQAGCEEEEKDDLGQMEGEVTTALNDLRDRRARDENSIFAIEEETGYLN